MSKVFDTVGSETAPRRGIRLPWMRGRGRPKMFTTYKKEMAQLNTPTKKLWMAVTLVVAIVLPFRVSDGLVFQMATMFVAAVGAIGLNIVSGYAGQVSLGHAFFLGLGAYTAAVLSGDTGPGIDVLGYGQQMQIWLPAAGIVAAIAGLVVSPIAFRLKGLYLAVVTLGLVFIGEHLFREAEFITGGPGVGRPAAVPTLFGYAFDQPGAIAGMTLSRSQSLYLMALVILVVMAVIARNLGRSKIGRAFAAIRDRDIAAEIMAVPLRRYKALAFTISSFYAGITGALLYTITGYIEPGSFNLGLSVQFIAMILIGGIATVSGSIMGAAFVVLLPRFVQELPRFIPFVTGRETGGVLTTQQLEQTLYGLLIILFLIFEPRGLYGIWVRVRNYWNAWPFSY